MYTFMGLNWEADTCKNLWDQQLLRFRRLQDLCLPTDKQLTIASDRFHLWLNIVHNYLFWSWINPNRSSGTGNNNDVVDDILHVVNRCLNLVLESFEKPCLTVEDNNKMTVLRLMELSLVDNILFYAEGTHNFGIQLLEIYFLTAQFILESFDGSSSSDVKSLERCAAFIQASMNLKDSFKTCCRTYDLQEYYDATHKSLRVNINQFKFGFHKINSRVGDHEIDAIFNALCITVGLCYLKLEKFKPSLACLSQSYTNCERGEKSSFILNYLKSYIYLQLKDIEKSLFFIRKILDPTLDCNMMARSVLLHGLILSYKGRFLEAQNEFFKVYEVDSYRPLALYYSAFNYKMYKQSQLNNGEVSMNVSETEDSRGDEELVGMLPITTMHALVLSLKDHSTTGINMKQYCYASFELKFLNLIHIQPEITTAHAIYFLARELHSCGMFKESADKLLHLLTFQQEERIRIRGFVLAPQIPPTNILMHETIAVLIEGKRWMDAETVCKQTLSLCTDEAESLIPNMLLARIQDHNGKEKDVLATLTKCLNLLDRWMTQNDSESFSEEVTVKELGNRIAAKIHVHFALFCLGKKSLGAAEKHFRRALCYCLEDKDALYHLLLLLASRISIGRELWKNRQATFSIVDKKCTNLALEYLLKTQVTNEEIEKLSIKFLVGDLNFSLDFDIEFDSS